MGWNEKTRLGAVEALGVIGPDAKDALEQLQSSKGDVSRLVRVAALRAMDEIQAK